MKRGLAEVLLESLINEAPIPMGPQEDPMLRLKPEEWFQKTKEPFVQNVLASMSPSIDQLLASLYHDVEQKRPGLIGSTSNLLNKFGNWWNRWFHGRNEGRMLVYSKILNEISKIEKPPVIGPSSSQPTNWTPNPYSVKDSFKKLKMDLQGELRKVLYRLYDSLVKQYIIWQNKKNPIPLSAYADSPLQVGKGRGRRITRAAQVDAEMERNPATAPTAEKKPALSKEELLQRLERAKQELKDVQRLATNFGIIPPRKPRKPRTKPEEEQPEEQPEPEQTEEARILKLLDSPNRTAEQDADLQSAIEAAFSSGDLDKFSDETKEKIQKYHAEKYPSPESGENPIDSEEGGKEGKEEKEEGGKEEGGKEGKGGFDIDDEPA